MNFRQDANWMNGEPVTAHDFVYAWRRLVDPATASEYSFMMEVAAVKNATPIIAGELPTDQLGVSAADGKTLVVELDRPVTYFLNLMTFPSFCPINEAYATEKGSQYALGADNLLCCGPFYMSAWDVGGNTYQLKKNPSYYDADKVELDVINFQIITDPQQTMLAYENGDIDACDLLASQLGQYKDSYGDQITAYHPLGTCFLSLNLDVDALKDAKRNHDALEAVYRPHVDFAGVDQCVDQELARLEKQGELQEW